MRALLLMCAAAMLPDQPPATPDVRAWKLPPVSETTLSNGLTVILVEDNRVPLVTMRLVFPGGSRRDPKDLPGVAFTAAEMLMHGTLHRTGSQLVESIDGMGASMKAGSSADDIVVGADVIAENLPELLEVAADVARNAAFPELELKLLLQSRRQVLARQRAQPGYVAGEAFRGIIFGEHPYAHAGPTIASLDQMSRQALIEYRDQYLVPNNAVLILVGKLPVHAQAMKVVSDRFSSWPRKALAEAAYPPPPAAKRSLILMDRAGAAQAAIYMGRIAAPRSDADYFPGIVGAVLLGRGLPPDVHIEPSSFDEASVFALSMQVRNDAVGEALQITLDRMERLAKGTVTVQELSDAKTSANGSFLLRMESQAGLADNLAMFKVQHLPADTAETYPARINAVQAEQVREAAKKYLVADDDAIVVVGDASKIQQQLKKVGEFQVIGAK